MKDMEFFDGVRCARPSFTEEAARNKSTFARRIKSLLSVAVTSAVLAVVLSVAGASVIGHGDDAQSHAVSLDAMGNEIVRESIYELTVSPDERSIYYRTMRGELCRLTISEDLELSDRQSLFPNEFCEIFAISSDHRFLMTAHRSGAIVAVDLTQNNDSLVECPVYVPAKDEAVLTIAYSPDSRFAAVGTSRGKVLIWDLSEQREVLRHQFDRPDLSMLKFYGNDELIIGLEKCIERWAIDGTGKLTFVAELSHDYSACDVGVIPDARRVVIGYHYGRMVCNDLTEARSDRIWEKKAPSPICRTIVPSPDGAMFTCSIEADFLSLHDTATGEPLRELRCPGMKYVTSAVFSRSGELLYTSSTDGMIRIWSIAGGFPVLQFDPSQVNPLEL